MPSDDQELNAVKARLAALLRCIVTKAESDTDFAAELKEILLSDTIRTSIRKRVPRKQAREVFDPVAFLGSADGKRLGQELSSKTTSDLRDIIRVHRVLPPKRAKTTEREELIDLLLAYAQRKLDQGGAFNRA